MIIDINFLVVKNKARIKRKTEIIVVRAMAVFSLILIGVSAFLFYYLSNVLYPKSLKEEYETLASRLNASRNLQIKLIALNNRLSSISEVLGKRKTSVDDKKPGEDGIVQGNDYSKIITKFYDSIPLGIKIDNLKVEGNSINLTFSSSSLKPIEELIDNFILLGQEKTISVLALESLVLNESLGGYVLSLKASL